MELTINIKNQEKMASFIDLIKDVEYLEIIDIKDDNIKIPVEHKNLLEKRLIKIQNNDTSFKSWDDIKKKYGK